MSTSNIDKIREEVEKLKKLADAMYYAAQQLTTDASRLHKAMDEYHKFIIHEYKEEPASEDFKIALEKKVREAQDWTYIEEEGCECPLNEEFGAYDLEEFARWGAEWQITKLAEEAGEHEVKVDAGGYPYIPQIELYDYIKDIPLAKEGDKYKVILIKK